MIHYYSYYSVGGYKDMYLGNRGMTDCECTFYLPLLPIKEEEAKGKNDEKLNSQIAEMKKLAQIEIATSTNHIGLPSIATSITTKGCYRMIYTHLEGEKHAIVLHDVNNDEHDSSGRSIPFLVMFMSDSSDDVKLMDKLAAYIAANMRTATNALGTFFKYDPNVNGLRFELAKMNAWVNSVLQADTAAVVHANGSRVAVHGRSGCITLLIARSGIPTKDAICTLGIDKTIGAAFCESDYQPLDNKELAQRNAAAWSAAQKRLMCKYIVIGGVCVFAALMVAYCITRCTK